MAGYKDITLSNGEGVRVYAPPSIRIRQMVTKKHPDPQVPIVEDTTVTGKTIRMAIEDDPTYLAECARMEEIRREEEDELGILFALKDVRVPEGWEADAELGDILTLSDPDWEPRVGRSGRKLDYIEWVLLANPADVMAVQGAIAELIGIDLEAIESIEDSFRGEVEEPTA